MAEHKFGVRGRHSMVKKGSGQDAEGGILAKPGSRTFPQNPLPQAGRAFLAKSLCGK